MRHQVSISEEPSRHEAVIIPFPTAGFTDDDRTDPDCRHELRTHGKYGLIACDACGMVEWMGVDGPVDPAEALAALFGTFDLVDRLESVRAPGPYVLAYRPPRTRRRALGVIPVQGWWPAGTDLWVASDGELLLLATRNRLMVENLTREA